jgi:hypothetical protein
MRIYKTFFFVEDNVRETEGARTAEIEMRSWFVNAHISFLAPSGIALEYIEEVDLDTLIAELQKKREELYNAWEYHNRGNCDCENDDYLGRPYAETHWGENCAEAEMLGLQEDDMADHIRELEQLREQVNRT